MPERFDWSRNVNVAHKVSLLKSCQEKIPNVAFWKLEDFMKILYVSDLDGTLLRSNAKTSEYTNQVINQLTSKGMLFSYATARSYLTSTKVTKGLNAKIPIITYNGAVILQNDTYEIIAKNSFDPAEKEEILNELLCHNIYPIVYSYISGKEKFSYLVNECNRITADFLSTHKEDIRNTPVEIADESYAVENAVDELKAIATGIIGSNDSDSVAKWLYNKFLNENIASSAEIKQGRRYSCSKGKRESLIDAED